MATVQEVSNYVRSLVGTKGVDADGVYGEQCMDLIVHLCQKYWGWRPSGNAIALSYQALPPGWQRIVNTPSFIPQEGDIVIWGLGSFSLYGHTGYGLRFDMNTFNSIDQNWLNPSLTVGSPPANILHNYTGVWGVLRPPYSKGGSMDIIQNQENWYARCNKTHLMLRGRVLSREVFGAWVGKRFMEFVEVCEDDKEADAWYNKSSDYKRVHDIATTRANLIDSIRKESGAIAVSGNDTKTVANINAQIKKLKIPPTTLDDMVRAIVRQGV